MCAVPPNLVLVAQEDTIPCPTPGVTLLWLGAQGEMGQKRLFKGRSCF